MYIVGIVHALGLCTMTWRLIFAKDGLYALCPHGHGLEREMAVLMMIMMMLIRRHGASRRVMSKAHCESNYGGRAMLNEQRPVTGGEGAVKARARLSDNRI